MHALKLCIFIISKQKLKNAVELKINKGVQFRFKKDKGGNGAKKRCKLVKSLTSIKNDRLFVKSSLFNLVLII